MKKIFLFATMFAVSLSMLAQEYMHVWQDGKKTDYVVTEVDSVTFNKMMHNGHEYVDLGLPSGTLWATCNVGATKPEEYGDYFAWGETAPKSTYNWDTYRWGTYSEGVGKFITKYCTNGNCGIVDNKTTLDLSDDAAHINWGGTWRMPNDIEISELCNNCVKEFTTLNDVQGYKVVGLNGNYIFLPLTGCIDENDFFEKDGYYWSNTLDINVTPPHSYFPNILYFTSDTLRLGLGMRSTGKTIRPVCTSLTQCEMYVWQNGGKTTFVVADVDSVTFSGSNLTNPTTPNDGIGVFSVGEGKTVTFSPGNLQYHPANDEWRFAENQTDYIGDANGNISSTYNGWLDLLGWSTSATNFGVSTSTDDEDYSGSFVDWGTNKIGNDVPNTWRTLTGEEWNYLLRKRPNYSELCGVAQVNGVNGLIFLPDNWTCPAGVTFKSGFHSSNGVEYYVAYQTFTADQWSELESIGAVFLPAAGYRYGSNVSYVQYNGTYWSAPEVDSDDAYGLTFFSDGASMTKYYRCLGLSVRLVKDL